MASAPAAPERAKLSRSMKPQWIWAIALGSAVGWGAFIQPTDWMATAGPLGAILGMAIGGALMCLIAVSYGLLIQTFPVSGGEYAYTYASFGRIHAYICGWFLTLGYIAIVALNASAMSLLFRRMVPPVVKWVPLWEVAGWQVYLGEIVVTSAALLLFAWLNGRGATLSGRLQFVFCCTMLGGVVLMLLAAVLSSATSWDNVSPGFPEGTSAVPAVLAIVAVAPWAYVGFDNVPQSAEEFNFAPHRAFRLIILAILAAIAIYAAMITTTALSFDWSELVASEPAWGTADSVAHVLGAGGLVLLAVSISMGIFTGLNGFFGSASRLLFAMGRAHTVPAAFGTLSRHGTPTKALWFVAAICLVAPWFGREALNWVVDMSSVGVTIAYTYACLVAFRTFRWSPKPGEEVPTKVLSPVKKTLSALGAATGVAFFLLLMTPGSPAQLTTPSLVALLVWLALGVAFYFSHRKASAAVSDDEMHYLVLGTTRPAK